MAAPALQAVRLEPDEVQPLFDRLMRNVELMLAQQRIHGDLSAFNVLYWEGDIRLIDFPQAVAPAENPDAFELLRARRPAPVPVLRALWPAHRTRRHRARPVDRYGAPREEPFDLLNELAEPGKTCHEARRLCPPAAALPAAPMAAGGGPGRAAAGRQLAVQLINPQIIRYFLDTAQSGGSQHCWPPRLSPSWALRCCSRSIGLGAIYAGERVGWAATNACGTTWRCTCCGSTCPFTKPIPRAS